MFAEIVRFTGVSARNFIKYPKRSGLAPSSSLSIFAAIFLILSAVLAPHANANPFNLDAAASPDTITAEEWAQYARRFVGPDGRVIDVDNGGQSHSEGQGYGMLIALAAGQRADFDRVWSFARKNLQVRRDALFSWRWTPHAKVTDDNNASDGDILIAYALVKAAVKWHEPRYLHAAFPIIEDIGESLITQEQGLTVLRPASFGFDEIPLNGGPVLNLSYYIYPAFLLFEATHPQYPWGTLIRDGLALTEAARFGSADLVPDWIALRREGTINIAHGFAAKSSYDAVRIPLYMMLGGHTPRALSTLNRSWRAVGNGTPADYHLGQDRSVGEMRDPGYRMIGALMACATEGATIPAFLSQFQPTTYFASSLHLLALSTAREHFSDCLEPFPSYEMAYSGNAIR